MSQIIPKENIFVEYAKWRIKSNKNLLIAIVGDTGSGKSWAAISIAKKLDKNFNETQLIFTYMDLIDIVEERRLPKGSCIVFDEASAEALQARDFMSKKNKGISALLQTFRNLNYILIFTCPDISYIDRQARCLLHLIMVTKRIEYANSSCVLQIYQIKTSIFRKGRYYEKLKIFDCATDTYYELTHLVVGKPDDEMLRAYDIKKAIFQKLLYAKLREQYATPTKTTTPEGFV